LLKEEFIGSGDSSKTYLDVLVVCPLCEMDQKINNKREETKGSWTGIIFFTIPVLFSTAITISFLGFSIWMMILLIIEPFNTTISSNSSIMFIPIFSFLFLVLGYVFGIKFSEVFLKLIDDRIKIKKRLREYQFLLLKKDHLSLELNNKQTKDLLIPSFDCDYHSSEQAVDSCHKCQKLICQEDKMIYKTNKSVPRSARKSKENREANLCHICFSEEQKQKSLVKNLILGFILFLYMSGGLTLVSLGLQTGDITFFLSGSIYTIFLFLILKKFLEDLVLHSRNPFFLNYLRSEKRGK
jgi:uncharacterized protein YbaR (Trm112 family)